MDIQILVNAKHSLVSGSLYANNATKWMQWRRVEQQTWRNIFKTNMLVFIGIWKSSVDAISAIMNN